MKYAPKHIPPAKEARITFPSYEFAPWDSLHSLPKDSVVNLIGEVASAPLRCDVSGLSKAVFTLANGQFIQEVVLLGAHAEAAQFRVGDTVVLAGLQVKEWKGDRTLQTSLLTAGEVNPPARCGLPEVAAIDASGTKRKAMRMSARCRATVKEITSKIQSMIANIAAGAPPENEEVLLQGVLSPLTPAFFDADPPLVGPEEAEKMCLVTELADTTGSVSVKVWDKACRALFDFTAAQLRELWERGVDDAASRVAVLESLNRHLHLEVRVLCSLSVWSYGQKERHHVGQVDVSLLEITN